jgi:hypothetical protein
MIRNGGTALMTLLSLAIPSLSSNYTKISKTALAILGYYNYELTKLIKVI